MKKIYITAVIALCINIVFAQQKGIGGFVSDLETGEKIIGAIVFEEGTNNAVSTNEFGYFTLHPEKKDSIVISAHYLSYNKQTKTIKRSLKGHTNFQLRQNNSIDEVVIHGEQSFVNKNETSII